MSKTQSEIKIPKGLQTIAISKLKPNPKNIKIHTDKQIEGLAEVIKLLGIFKDPVVIDKKNTIWIGHGRLEAAKLLGMTEVPYVYNDHLTVKQRKALMILDNKLNESAWNEEQMQELLIEIPEFNFEPFNVDFDEFKPEPEIVEDEVPKPRPKTDIKLGEIYQLGNHKIMCGDCRNKDTVKQLLGNATVDSLQTDPPYGVDYLSKNEFLNEVDKGNRIQTGLINDSDTIKDYREFFADFLKLIPFSKYNTVYVWMSDLRSLELRQAFLDAGITFSQCIQWIKNNHVLSRLDYQPKHETCFYGRKGKHKFYGNASCMSTKPFDKPHVSDLHPTMKPVGLIAECIQEGTSSGGTIYDPFLGSGTTLVAAEQTGRVCFGMEIDPVYVQVIIDRWEKFSNQKARKM